MLRDNKANARTDHLTGCNRGAGSSQSIPADVARTLALEMDRNNENLNFSGKQ